MKTIMRTFSKNQTKSTAFALAIAVLMISSISIYAGLVQGRTAILPAAGTTPVVNATLSLNRTVGPAGTVTCTTDLHGNFTFSNVEHGAYNMTITPAPTFTTSGRGVIGTPFQAWANFNMDRGLLVAGLNATTAATGPIAVMSNGSLRVSLSFAGPVSGTLTK
jgi:hypothetical protein